MLAIILMIFCVTLSRGGGGGGGGVAFVQCDNATTNSLTLLPSLSPSLVSSHPTSPKPSPPPSPPIDLVTSAKQMARTHSTNITAAKLETASAKLKHM